MIPNNINVCIGEVISANRLTYKQIADKPFEIRVSIIGNQLIKPPIDAIPYNINELQIPVIGELVVLLKGVKKNSKPGDKNTQWYYLKPMSTLGSINKNDMPGVSKPRINKQISKIKASSQQIISKTISPLQPSPGDIIYQGRWGNTIRLGSTNITPENSKKLPYTGQIGDPIIILSNGKQHEENKYVVENINEDPASLYLTSTQQIPSLKLNHDLRIGTSPIYTEFANSQLIGTADRIILTSKNDIIVLDSTKGIEINSKNIKIGINKEKESMLYSGIVKQVLQGLIDIVSTGFKTSDGAIATKLHTPLEDLNNLMTKIDNDNIKVDKYSSNI